MYCLAVVGRYTIYMFYSMLFVSPQTVMASSAAFFIC